MSWMMAGRMKIDWQDGRASSDRSGALRSGTFREEESPESASAALAAVSRSAAAKASASSAAAAKTALSHAAVAEGRSMPARLACFLALSFICLASFAGCGTPPAGATAATMAANESGSAGGLTAGGATAAAPIPAMAPILAASVPAKTFSLAELESDYLQLRRIVVKSHPNLYTGEAEMARFFDEGARRLRAGMTEIEFYRVLTPVVAALRCGHTNLSVSESEEAAMRNSARYLPLVVTVRGNRIFVLENMSEGGRAATGNTSPELGSTSATAPGAGSEILSINGRSAKNIVAHLFLVATADGWNMTKKTRVVDRWFNGLYRLNVEDPATFSLEYLERTVGESTEAAPGGVPVRTAVLPAARIPEMDMTALGLHMPRREDAPLYRGSVEGDRALLTIKSFSPGNLREYKKYLDDFFDGLSAGGVEKLVIDLRGNFGGDPRFSIYLLDHLVTKRTPYFAGGQPFYFYMILGRDARPARNAYAGRLAVIMDGSCFSTTGHLLSVLKAGGIGILVGEESGGSRVVTDGAFDAVLKNTGLRLHCADKVIETVAPGLPAGRGVMPDRPVAPTLDDRLAGFDPAMAEAVRVLSE